MNVKFEKKGNFLSLFVLYFIIKLKFIVTKLNTSPWQQVFQVTGGTVQFRDWSDPDVKFTNRKKKGGKPSNKTLSVKTRMCWFDSNHPDGCPRNPQDCSFLHRSEVSQDSTKSEVSENSIKSKASEQTTEI